MNPNINLINSSRRTKSPKTLLDAFETVIELAKDSEMNEEFFGAAKPAIKYITRKLEISRIQAVMLSICVDRSEQSKIRLSEIAQFLGIGTISMLKHSIEIDGLVEKHYLKMSNRRDERTYRVPTPVLKAIRLNMAFENQEDSIATTQDFFDRFNTMAREKKSDNMEYDNLKRKTFEMLEDIKESVFVRTLNRYKFYDDDLVLFIFMAHLFIEDNDDDIRFGDIEDLYDDEEIPSRIKRLLRSHQHELFETGLIENGNEDGMARPDSFKLTDKAKEELLSELSIQSIGKSQTGLISHESLVKKELIYNAEEEKSINELFALLEVSRFKDIQNRLKDAGMRPGFCCIFYGAPGTGKTETVYQLAKNTGRNILQVDVDKIKSCWVGESEKNIKALFDRYRNICKSTDVAPILLFNEADAVLGTRMEGASRAVDKMENSLQNIILQEMEKLEGIMIATTNLTTNLDKAFERRFLYKIKFEKPAVESRARIWQSILPELSAEESKYLADKYDLSGGEIENVVRKATVNSILKGDKKIELDYIENCCAIERISDRSFAKIGFNTPSHPMQCK